MSDLLLQTRFAPLLEGQGLICREGGLTLLNTVSFDLGAGELLGLMGPDKAAANTLLDVCSGLHAPEAGHLYAFGQPVDGDRRRSFAALGITRCFAHPRLPGDGSVIDFLGFAVRQIDRAQWWHQLAPARRASRQERGDLLGVLEFLGIARLGDYPLIGLGLHHRRLVDMARALLQRPRVLLLERPLEGLDAPQRSAMMTMTKAIAREGVALMVADDDLAGLASLCPRLLVLHGGRLIADGPPDVVGGAPQVLEAFTGSASP